MLCFWPFERRKLKLVIKDKCGGECYGCSIYNPECAARLNCLGTLLGVLYTDRRGYSDSVRSLQVASYGQNGERQMKIPRFLYVVTKQE